ncbi:MAG: type II secretion system F family protein [Candidatus Longimicrobiales bacterium M2_2A_002]
MSTWIPAFTVFIAVASATVALVLILESARTWYRRRQVRQRVDEMLEDPESESAPARGNLFRSAEQRPSVFEALVARVPQLADLPALIEMAGVSWSVQSFLVFTAGSALAALLAGLMLTGSLVLAGLMAVPAAWVPYMVLRFRRSRRIARFEEAFPEAIDMLGRAIRAGHPLSAGINMVGQEMSEPVGSEFRRMFEQQRFGAPFSDTLMGMVDRIDLVDVRIFTTAVLVQREVGGNLAEILDNISNMIRARFRIRRQLRTYTAQGKMSGWIVGSMPFAVGAAFYGINPDYAMVLVDHPIGRLMMVVALTLQVFGIIWIRKVVNIEI